MPLLQGDPVGRYVIDGFLGAGGMGEVYRAHDARLDRRVALKIVRAGAGGESAGGDAIDKARASDGAQRMMREARAVAALEHPNVVSIYDVGEVETGPLAGTTFIAMELIKGNSLRAYVGDKSVLMEERVRWLIDVARALSAAHAAGIVHRDVKPENVMVRHDGIVKVLDFGIAKRSTVSAVDPASPTQLATNTGAVVGTPMYMAPEQLRGEPLDGRADQFAWGVLAFELLSGTPPWPRGAGTFVVGSQILSEAPAPLEALVAEQAGVPSYVVAAVARALSKDAARRFASMDELVEALGGAVRRPASIPSSSPPQATRGTVPDDATPAPRRRSSAPMVGRATSTDGGVAAGVAPRGAAPPAKEPSTPSRWRGAAAVVVAMTLAALFLLLRKSAPTTAPPTSAPSGCTGQRSCVAAHGGEPWICRESDHACVAVASADCAAHFDPEDLAADDTVWLGAIIPLTGPRAQAYGIEDAKVLELARRDFASVGGILRSADGKLRRLGVVVCDGASDARRAAEHLAALEVPAVIGPAATLKDTLDVVTNVFVPARTLVIDVFDQSPLVTKIPQPAELPRLVWRLTLSAEQAGEALAHVVSDHVVPNLRRVGGPLADGRPMKLAVVRSESSTATSILDAFVSSVRMNDRPVVENAGLFQQFTFRRAGMEPAAKRELVADVVAFAPDVIVYADGSFFQDTFVEEIEGAWRTSARPTYVSEGLLDSERLLAFIGASSERRRRFLSVELPANTDENFRLVLHHNEAFSPKITPGTAPGVLYDAFYVAAFAAAAAQKPHLTGVEMGAAMARLGGDGAPIGVGPSHIFEAYDTLRQGRTLRLTGAGTQLDLDHAHGEIPTDFAVYCLNVDRAGRAAEPVESGLRFDHRSKRLEGAFECP